MMNNDVLDYLGTPIRVGDRAIRVHTVGHFKEFKKVTVTDIKTPHKIGVLTDGNDKIGWTFPERLIVHRNFKIPI